MFVTLIWPQRGQSVNRGLNVSGCPILEHVAAAAALKGFLANILLHELYHLDQCNARYIAWLFMSHVGALA